MLWGFAHNRVITNFKTELSNNVTLKGAKEIEQALRDMYRKFVKQEKDTAKRRGVRRASLAAAAAYRSLLGFGADPAPPST